MFQTTNQKGKSEIDSNKVEAKVKSVQDEEKETEEGCSN